MKFWNRLKTYKETLKDKIEESGGIGTNIFALLVTIVFWPFIVLYIYLLRPIFRVIRTLIEAKKHGLRKAFRKQFYNELYEEEQKEEIETLEEEPLIPDGKWKKGFKEKEYWPDTFVVDGKAIYGAEGRILLYVDEHVEEFDVPEGVENIYHRCFACCDMLKRVSLPSSLKRIGKRAFFSCVSLKEIVIPESVYVIGEEMFMNCSSLENVVLPSQMTEIPARTFCNCRSLRYYKLPKEVRLIEKEAFRRCYALEHIETNEKLELIGKRGFEECHSLKEFIMPESVRSCTEGMFNGCHSLQHIHFSSQIKDFGGSCCRDCWNINQISMPTDEEAKSYARQKWENYAKELDISKSENPIPESMFWTIGDTLYFGIPRLTSVCLVFCFSKDTEYTIPSFVTNIKRDAFTSCRNLRTLRLSPFIKASSDPWEFTCVSHDFIYEYWPQIENVIFDETLKSTKYAFGLIA